MPYRLIITQVSDVPSDEHAFDLDRDIVLVGRRAGVDVPLPHPAIAGLHLRLERHGSEIYAVEPGAGADILIQGKCLGTHGRHLLAEGDEIILARVYRLRYVTRGSPEPTTAEETADLARALVRDVLSALGKAGQGSGPTLALSLGPDNTRVIALPIPGRDLVLGRGESSDAMLVDPDLSREHVRIGRTWSGSTIEDLGSKNGTWVGEARLVTGKPVDLHHGDRIRMGSLILEFRDPAEEWLNEVTRVTPAAKETLPAAAPELRAAEEGKAQDVPMSPPHRPSLHLPWTRVILALIVVSFAVTALILLFLAG